MLRENFLKEVKGFIELEKEEFLKIMPKKVFLRVFLKEKKSFLRND